MAVRLKFPKIYKKQERCCNIRELLKPTNDYVFKRIFGYIGNEDITKGLLNSILDIEIEEVELDCKESLEKDLQSDKYGILDIKAKINNGIQCDIEMQLLDRKNIEKRLLFYWSKLYASTIKESEDYIKLKKTIIILFSNYNIENLKTIKNKYMSKWQIREEEYQNIVLTKDFEIYIIELEKYKNSKNKDLDTWIKFIKNPEEISMSDTENNKPLKKAKDILDEISDPEEREWILLKRQMARMDKKAVEDAYVEKGYNKAKEEYDKEKQEIAKKMLEDNIPLETIIRYTGLTKEEIENIE